VLKELRADNYGRVRSLFGPIGYNLAIDSIVTCLSPGSIYVDDLDNPRLALIWTQSRVFLGGQAQDKATLLALQRTLYEVYYPDAVTSGVVAFTLHFTPGWDKLIERVLAEKHLMPDIRHYYELDASGMGMRLALPAKYELKAVNETLLANSGLKHLDRLIAEMQSERPSVEDFLTRSFGYCAICDESIVAWCMSEYNCDDYCEIGIFTDESHRRLGLAAATATAVFGHASKQGISNIGWHCWESNEASIALALKLGFMLNTRYPVYFGYIDPLQNLTVNGYISLRRGDARRAVEWFEQAQALGDLPPWAIPHMEQAKLENMRYVSE
jgi:RimJ/RimL family protein N-acetyltransferase